MRSSFGSCAYGRYVGSRCANSSVIIPFLDLYRGGVQREVRHRGSRQRLGGLTERARCRSALTRPARARLTPRVVDNGALRQHGVDQAVFVDGALAFFAEKSTRGAELPQADRRQAQITIGHRPV